MSEDIEKSLEERIEDARLEQILDIQTGASSSEVCDRHRWEHEGIIDENIKEHVEECLGEMLNNYIDDDRNYIVDGAIIKCDRMSEKKVFVQFMRSGSRIRIEGAKETIPSDYKKPDGIGPDGHLEQAIFSHVGEENIRKLYAVHGSERSANNIPFATVIDRTCLRKEEAKGVNAEQGIGASIVSCGNCKILREEDIKKIAENWEGVSKYGTCYLFINPNYEWKNPYCTESVVGKCNTPAAVPVCTVSEHHRPMKFDTEEGEKEGLTMLSTLLCIRGGVITIEAPGQIYIEHKLMKFSECFTYVDKDGNIKTAEWTISDEEFRDYDSLTLEEIERICNSHNPELVKREFHKGIYIYCINNQLNPKVLLATLGQEQSWCNNGNYDKAFGVGMGGNPEKFANSDEGIAHSGNTYIKRFEDGLNANSLVLAGINKDMGPEYRETKAALKNDEEKVKEWQSTNSSYVDYMEKGQDIECVNAAMYAKLCYTPWVDFPPSKSHPLEDWLKIYNSLEECLIDEK